MAMSAGLLTADITVLSGALLISDSTSAMPQDNENSATDGAPDGLSTTA